jgi:hypothetical protein
VWLVAVVLALAAMLAVFANLGQATGWIVTIKTGYHGACYWEDTIQHGPQRASASTKDNNGQCYQVGVRLKFDSGYTDDCSAGYILTNWYSDSNAQVVLGAIGAAGCQGYHYHRLSSGYTQYKNTYPCSPFPC